MDTKTYEVKITAKDILSLDGNLTINARQGGKIVGQVSKPCDNDQEGIMFTPEKYRLQGCIFSENHYETCTKLPYRFYISERMTTAEYMFSPYIKVKEMDVSHLDTTRIVSMNYMFGSCESLKKLDLPKTFDTSKVKDFSGMFVDCYELEYINGVIDLSGLHDCTVNDVNKRFTCMFNGCNKLKHVFFKNVPDWFFKEYDYFGRGARVGWRWLGLERRDQFEIVE